MVMPLLSQLHAFCRVGAKLHGKHIDHISLVLPLNCPALPKKICTYVCMYDRNGTHEEISTEMGLVFLVRVRG